MLFRSTSVTMVAAGSCSVVANQAGNANYNAAPAVTQSFTITATVPGAPTIGTGTAGPNQATISFTPPANNGASVSYVKRAACSKASSAGSSRSVSGR